MSDAALALENVTAGYGETKVLEDLSLAIGRGESVSLIGRNGVGKSTLLAAIMGHATLHGGRIALDGRDISRLAPHRRARAGLGWVPQEREIFASLSVEENLDVAARPGRWTKGAVFDLFPHLAARRRNGGMQLSGGEQQMLSIARALMGNPRVLLMDEPSEGLAPTVVEELSRSMQRLRDEHDLTIVLVEQRTTLALEFSARTVVMDRGRATYDGPSRALADDPARLEALIGVSSGL
ncbi:MAG TPA: ABC transporter ATP-binding protein [Candidatus Cybelea sp.]|nr:ABC transporter ATP-binding protein [Candidatus Cybelea sp.]